MTISIQMYTCNLRPTLMRRAIKSVLDQSYSDFKVVIYNGGSDFDDELKNMLNDSRIDIFSGPKVNIAEARNKCCERIGSGHIMTLDDDDWIDPDCLETLVKHTDDNDLVYGDCVIETGDGRPSFKRFSCSIPYSPDNMIRSCCVFHPFAFSYDIFNRVGGYDTSFTYAAVYDFLLKVSEIDGMRVKHIPKILYHYWSAADHESTRSDPLKKIFILEAQNKAYARRGTLK